MATGADVNPQGTDLFRALAKAVYLAAAILVLLWFLHEIQSVLLFFLLALVLAVAMNAPVVWLERRGIPRVPATLGVSALGLGAVGLLGWLVIPRLVRDVTALVQSLPQLLTRLAERISFLLRDYPELERQIALDEKAAAQLFPWVMGLAGDLWRYSFSLVAVLLLTLLLVSVVIYMVVDPRPLLEGYLAAVPPHLRAPAARAFARASRTTVGWMSANVILGTMKAVPVFLFLRFMDIPGALVWAVLGFFSQAVPRLGFYVMAIPPTLVALSIDPARAGWVLLFLWGLSELLGNFVAPRVQASTMDLHPVFILFVMLAMGAAFGLVGVLIATPVAGFIRAYFVEFYLARQPEDQHLRERVDAILRQEELPEGT
jgi:putative permease